MAEGSRIFRKQSLDRLADPDQLDEGIRVIRPRDLLVSLTLIALLAAGVAWLFLGRTLTTVQAVGIFSPADGTIVQVSAPAEGSLSELFIRAGQEVAAGETLAIISQPELLLELQQAQQALVQLEARAKSRLAQIDDRATARANRLAARTAALTEQLAANERRVAATTEQVQRDAELFSRGLITRRAVDENKRLLDDAQQAVLNTRSEQITLQDETLAADQEDSRDRLAQETEVQEAKARVSALDLRAREQRAVVSPAAGRVKELVARAGERVQPGTRIATLETGEAPVQLVAYVSPESGKRINTQMSALVVPSTVRRAELGSLRAQVVRVSDAPVSPQAMLAVLGNESLLSRFAPQGAPFEVVIDLTRDAAGFPVWAAGQGPPLALDSGTLAEAEITLRSDPPIALILPVLRTLFQAGGAK